MQICRDCNKPIKISAAKNPRCKACRRSQRYRRRAQDPVGHWAKQAVRGAKRRSEAFITPEEVKQIVLKQDKKCWYCLKDLRWLGRRSSRLSPTMDKVIPKNGYRKGNIVIACRRCNRIKSDSNLQELKGIVEGLKRWNSGQ